MNQHMEATVRRDLPMILIRVIVGLVFLLEGVLKFVSARRAWARGALPLIGLPFPHQLAALVGGVEIGAAARSSC